MTTSHRTPILLIPGYWLGAWVWDAVADRLAALGCRPDAITLPGLDPRDAARASVRFADHVAAVAHRVRTLGPWTVLVAHSGAGEVATAVTDRMPKSLARVIYVDSGPIADGTVPRPDLSPDDTELAFPGLDTLEAQGISGAGLTADDRARLTSRAVPHPAGACREPITLHDPRRNRVPTTLICCSIPGHVVRDMTTAGVPMFAALRDLADLTLVDLPTGHWPMLSRPVDLAGIIAQEADRE
ncbi:MAG: alpha/beta hydrolase [Actinomycetia bacterium]|nr:alpha/beta hydrolase [Actinomycetes bacterium]